MNFEEAYNVVKSFAEQHKDLFHEVDIQLAIGKGRLPIGNWSDINKIGMVVTGDNIGNKSGIYFFTTPQEEIIYIGKAGQNNLHERVWGHLKTPKDPSPSFKTFPNHRFVKSSEFSAFFTNGEAKLGVITVSKQFLVSLLEVYLQTFYFKKYGRLPYLNKQIG